MDYLDYADELASVSEYYLYMSDGASIRIIDFVPEDVSGVKPVIVFVAGWISLISGWSGLLREITPLFRTIYMETREKSSSEVSKINKNNFTINRLKQDIGDVIKHLIPENVPFVLAGSSLGASTILEYSVDADIAASAAILIGPNSEFRFPKILGDIIPAIPPSMYFAVKPVIKWYLKNFRLDKKNSPEQVEKYERTLDAADPYKLKANALALKNYKINSNIGNITIPCLVMGATSDKLHGTESIKKLASAIPQGEYVELASNMETHNEKAGRVIAEYINRVFNS